MAREAALANRVATPPSDRGVVAGSLGFRVCSAFADFVGVEDSGATPTLDKVFWCGGGGHKVLTDRVRKSRYLVQRGY